MNDPTPEIDPTDSTVRDRVQARREQLESHLAAAPDDSNLAHRIEGKLRDLERILADGWENMPDDVMAKLEAWLAETAREP